MLRENDMTKYPDLEEEGTKGLDEIKDIYLETMDRTTSCANNRMKYQLNREMIDGEAFGGRKLTDAIVTSFEQNNASILPKMQEDGLPRAC